VLLAVAFAGGTSPTVLPVIRAFMRLRRSELAEQG
jgi:hypothetical protein